ncbi:hypothetical protein GQ53DRAFT_665434 [Thozetella sp. PMI_491]|nr:hypothetical protein GQ53DRAFT_665434 [Thozetella sp. PMI_491]
MQCGDYQSPASVSSSINVPYSSSLATSASSASVWSDASSQHSDDTSITAPTSESDESSSLFYTHAPETCWAKHTQIQSDAPSELRRNPRRTSHSATSRTGCPPPLVRQADRKVNFVDNLVDSSTHIVEAIWPTSSVVGHNETGNGGVLPLRTFIQETLRRSRTSYSTLQVALYYLVLIKPHVPDRDFTMEQVDDCYASRAIQCGRRMFLAALILASKYLQDRNYSARAWSKISGLNTQEINQNEMTFLLAVSWKLHITDDVYNRWTDCVMKFTPPQPPSPGSSLKVYERQCEEFRNIILSLNPELDNLEEVLPESPVPTLFREIPPRTLFTPSNERVALCAAEVDFGVPKTFGTPATMEPTPSSVYTPGRFAPALGLLPTPRLTPQTSGFSTPAVNAASQLLGKTSSMGLAIAQACNVNAVQNLDRWPGSVTSSPQCYVARRSSLANSVSTASSPESMVSDTSRTSRSSSISSASSLASAPSSKLDVLARCRSAKLCSERLSLRPTIASVPEDYEEALASPESYTGAVGKDLCDMSLETPLARREREMDEAARALQELQHYRQGSSRLAPVPTAKVGSKRSRAPSVDNSLQDNVREMLAGRYSNESAWTDTLIRQRPIVVGRYPQQVPVGASADGARKRVCCSAEAARYIPSLHPAMGGMSRPGMWEGILN